MRRYARLSRSEGFELTVLLAGAAASFGFSSMLGLLVSTLLEKIGLETDPGFKMIALSPILLSSFKMDLSLRATVEGEEQADCICSCCSFARFSNLC